MVNLLYIPGFALLGTMLYTIVWPHVAAITTLLYL